PEEAVRSSIDTKYVGVPSMKVYAAPTDASAVITEYGYTESVSILARRAGCVEVRTMDGSGWAKAAELIDGKTAQDILDHPTPKFLTPPVAIPDPRAHGLIAMVASVNTDGDVVSAWKLADSTHSPKLIEANLAALRQAKFYPIVQKGQRLTFTYEYDVTY
ncbi:MAG TPA: hypothetical protein VI391_05370, partial [Thermoanaerobaculia bacterium]